MDLYKEELMDTFKNPAHRGSLDNSTVDVHSNNPMCGDQVDLKLVIEDNVVKDAKFDGSACFVSVISSEKLLDYIIGKKLSDIKKISKDDLLNMVNLNLTTSRVKCALLILSALEEALQKYERK